MDKIYAITSTSKSGRSFLDLRFGKSEYVALFNKANRRYTIFENPYKNEPDNGVKLLKHLVKEGVSVLITGEVGPDVSELLEKEKVQLVLLPEEKIKVEEVMNKIR